VTRFGFIAAFCLAVLTGNESWSEPLTAPILEGSVQQRLVLDKALLESLSPITVDVTFVMLLHLPSVNLTLTTRENP
jgi:hypothetical protein